MTERTTEASYPAGTPLRCAPLGRVRVAIVGLGRRGTATLRRFLILEGVEIVALCDVSSEALGEATAIVSGAGRARPTLYSDWGSVAAARPADLVVIATDWASHCEIACAMMASGMHVAVEVPAALTVADCRRLVNVSRQAGRHCFMMENCCYDPFTLRTIEMARRGVFGTILHCQGAYIHYLRSLYDDSSGWYGRSAASNGANPYPTHGLGPICMILGVGRSGGDTLRSLVSVSTAVEGQGPAPVNTTLILTGFGRTILLHHDVTTPQPYSRIQGVSGTAATIEKYPVERFMDSTMSSPLTGEALGRLMELYRSPIEDAYEADARRLGVDNLMNYYMDRRLIDCLRTGSPLDITVEDAALWSSVAELTARSARLGGQPVAFPDYA